MRFNVDQNYPFIHIEFKRGANRSFSPTYVPWVDTLVDIKLEVLTCVDHQKVASSWDNNPTDEKRINDGFAFEDRHGRLWSNNYHRASYGQLSCESDNWIHLLEEKMGASIDNDNTPWRMERLESRLNKILDGVRDLQKELSSKEVAKDIASIQSEIDQLMGFYKLICSQVEQQFGVKVVAYLKPSPSGTHPRQGIDFIPIV